MTVATGSPGSDEGVRWVTVRLPWDATFEICTPERGDNVGDILIHTNSYLPPHYELLPALAGAGSAVLDLGAHLGTFSLLAASLGHPVVAVEASPRNAELLRASAAANGFTDITVVGVAVSDHDGTVRFRHEGAWGQITTGRWDDDVVEVPARTVPGILESAGVDRVDLVKMDVEGSEPAAIAGMALVLARADAPALLYESNAHTLAHFDATPNDILRPLAEFGYHLYIVEDHSLIPIGADDYQPDTLVDVLAVKELPELPSPWHVRAARTDEELVAVVVSESRAANPHQRAAIARSLERAPARLLDHEAVRRAIEGSLVDPDEQVVRAAAWWRSRTRSVAELLQALTDQGHALRDRVERITTRWAAD
jgi:FkbM family methyltransferase